MGLTIRFLTPALFMAVALLCVLLGWLGSLDQALRDVRFTLDHRSPSGRVAFVDIDTRSISAVGVWPWPRSVHAEVLTRLLDLGAAEVAFDIDFSTPSTSSADDEAFEAALEDAGGYAILVGLRQLGTGVFTLPLPRFSQHTSVGGINVATDNLGIVRTVPDVLTDGTTVLPSLPSVLAGVRPPGSFLIDYSIDERSIDRISVADVLGGVLEESRVANRKIVIGASALELRDVMMTPTAGPLPGALIQVLATESLLLDRALQPPSGWICAMLLVGATGILLLVRLRTRRWQATLIAALGLSLTLEVAAFVLQARAGVLIDTGAVHLFNLLAAAAGIAWEVGERRRLHQDAVAGLVRMATYDSVTGVFTRPAFIQQVERALAAEHVLGVVSLRLDRFDRVAATMGAAYAEPALREVAMRLSSFAPLAIGRVGSESFAFLTSAADVVEAAQRLPDLLASPFAIGDQRMILSATVGYAQSKSDTGERAEALLNRAEVAQAAAQSAGTFVPTAYHSDLQRGFEEDRELEVALREALTIGSIEVFAQGQFELATGAFCGAEALARWRRPEAGFVSPARFVPLAERAGLAVALGRHILASACAGAAGWPNSVRLAVNVSPAQFEFDDVPRLIEEVLAASGLDPQRLDIEITEGLVLKAHPSTMDALNAIRQIGVGIALDDFGTGYSSLSYLSSLPITKLKIDQSFVRQLTIQRRAATIVEAILALCKQLDITVIAEGVETSEQAAWLKYHRCDIAQGFLFHRPAPISELAPMTRAVRSGSGLGIRSHAREAGHFSV